MKVYFLGIAGAGVSALASVLVSQGAEVTGSDEGVYPPVSTYLDCLGVTYHDGFDPRLVPDDIDFAIIGASAKLHGAENPELAAIKKLGVPTYMFPEYLGLHTKGRTNIVIAGSFGKSTLTALCAHLLRVASRDPGYFIGASPLDLPTTGHHGKDPEFLLEGDEYVISPEDRRSKFVLYHPSVTLISSLVHDHLNMFPTMESYVAPFAELVKLTPEDEESDVDLLVELDYDQMTGGLQFISMQLKLQQLLNRKVDLVSAQGLSRYILPFIEKEKKLVYAR